MGRLKKRTHSSWCYLMKCSWFSRFRDGTRLDTVNTTPARGALNAFQPTSNSNKTTRPITLLFRLIKGCPRVYSSDKLMILKYKNTNNFTIHLAFKERIFLQVSQHSLHIIKLFIHLTRIKYLFVKLFDSNY